MKDVRTGRTRGKKAIIDRLEMMLQMRKRELAEAQEQIAEEIRTLEAAIEAAKEAK